jgi:hypothetical protein
MNLSREADFETPATPLSIARFARLLCNKICRNALMTLRKEHFNKVTKLFASKRAGQQ